MKQIAFSLLLLFLFNLLGAQAPNKINYQAVARDATGSPLANQAVSVRLSIRSGAATGTVVYSETHVATTTAQGLVNLQIGMETHWLTPIST